MPGERTRWKKGQSGNPAGRPKSQELADVKSLAQSYAEEAIKDLVRIASNEKVAAIARVAAWRAVLDRACGKPRMEVEISGNPLTAVRVEFVGPSAPPAAYLTEAAGVPSVSR